MYSKLDGKIWKIYMKTYFLTANLSSFSAKVSKVRNLRINQSLPMLNSFSPYSWQHFVFLFFPHQSLIRYRRRSIESSLTIFHHTRSEVCFPCFISTLSPFFDSASQSLVRRPSLFYLVFFSIFSPAGPRASFRPVVRWTGLPLPW